MGMFSRFKDDPKTALAKKVLAQLKQAGVSHATYDEDEFAIAYRRPGDAGSGRIYLHNTFTETDGEPDAEVERRIATLIQAVVFAPERPGSWEAAREALRPVIRPATFGMGAPATAKVILARPVLAYLAEMVVIDTPTAMSYVTEDEVSGWGVSRDEVFAAARANLAARQPEISQEPSIVRFVDDGNGYFVSMLLVEGWLARFAVSPGDRPIAFIPDNNTLIVLPSEAALDAFIGHAEADYAQAARSISPQPYTVNASGALMAYPALAGHPAEAKVHRAATILATSEYASQKHWLDQRHEAEGTDIFVAKCAAIERADKSLFSYATWPDEVDTLLPRADFVAMAADGGSFMVSWATLTEYVELIEVPDMFPPRYRVTSWPEPSIMDALRARQVNP